MMADDVTVLIRPRVDADLPACARLVREVHASDRYPRYLPANLDMFLTPSGEYAPYGFWVAEDDGDAAAGEAGAAGGGGKETAGKETAGKETAGKETAGKETAGKETAGKETAGKDAAGKDAAGKEAAGKGAAGKGTSGEAFAGDVIGHVGLVARSMPSVMELASAALGRPADQLAVVARLFVSPRVRGHGTARELLRRAEAAAAARGLHPVLDVDTELSAAIALYESAGWTRAGTVTVRFGDGDRVLNEHVYLGPVT
jgi:GNAT superfamily N-acetyltransferase